MRNGVEDQQVKESRYNGRLCTKEFVCVGLGVSSDGDGVKGEENRCNCMKLKVKEKVKARKSMI